MISDTVKVSDARVQSLGLKFTFITQTQKLIIEAICSKDNLQYVGEIMAHPYIDFNDIKEILEEGTFKTIQKTEDLLKIKVGATPIQMISKSKTQIKELQQKVNKSLEKQMELQAIIEVQNDKIGELNMLISDIKYTVEEMKSSPKISQNSITVIEQIKQDCKMRIEDLRQELKLQISKIKYRSLDQAFEQKFRNLSITVRQGLDNLNLANDEIIKQIHKNKQIYDDQIQNIKTKTQQNTKMIAQLSSLKNTIHEVENKMKLYTTTIAENLSSSEENSNQTKAISLVLNEQCRKVSDIYKKIETILLRQTDYQTNLNQLNKKSCYSQNNRNLLPLNLPQKQIKWSQQLKAKTLKIQGKFLTKIQKNNQNKDVGLLQTSFSSKVKSKQCWAIRINKNSNGVFLGICLKNQMQKIGFDIQKVIYSQEHGSYIINAGGYCWSHSSKVFNRVDKSFKFNQGDTIFMEYDPINWVLRFRRNIIGERFELSIVPPLQNDAYHPCVGLYMKQSSVELILPGEPLS